jgi:hypothetical protein
VEEFRGLAPRTGDTVTAVLVDLVDELSVEAGEFEVGFPGLIVDVRQLIFGLFENPVRVGEGRLTHLFEES